MRKGRTILTLVGLAMLAMVVTGCTHVGRIALISDGELAGRSLTGISGGPMLKGQSCGTAHTLARAFRDALKGSGYDTLVDVKVTTTTGVFIWSNCIKVSGRGVKSASLPEGK